LRKKPCDVVHVLALHDVVDGMVGDWKIVYFLVIFIIFWGIILPSSRVEFLGGIRPWLLCIKISDGGTIMIPLRGCFS
jgi:hypothetical protein